MNIKKCLEIIEDFKKFGAKGIRGYPKEVIKEVLPEIDEIDRDSDWFKKFQKYLYEEDKKWWQSPLFVAIAGPIISGLILGAGGYFFGVQKTLSNMPIPSSNKQYRDIYAKQLFLNENGLFVIKGTALDQDTDSRIKFTVVSQDITVVKNDSVTSHNQSGGITAKEVNL